MKDKEEIIIDGRTYAYDEFYERLELLNDQEETTSEIRCPKCHNDLFSISYESYACVANCKCGHSMTVYDG